MLDSLAQGDLPLIFHTLHTKFIGLTVDGSPMAQEGFQEVRAGLPSDAGAHLGAGTPSLGVIHLVLCQEVSQDPHQVALELTGPIRPLNLRLEHREQQVPLVLLLL